jgi:hypothetical protein
MMFLGGCMGPACLCIYIKNGIRVSIVGFTVPGSFRGKADIWTLICCCSPQVAL